MMNLRDHAAGSSSTLFSTATSIRVGAVGYSSRGSVLGRGSGLLVTATETAIATAMASQMPLPEQLNATARAVKCPCLNT